MLFRKISIKKVIRRRFLRFVRLVLFLVILVVIGYFLNKLDVFKISEIEVLGAENFVDYRDIREVLFAQFYNKNILMVDISVREKTLLSTFQGAKSIKITRKFPNSIKVVIKERVPLALIYNENSKNMHMIDDSGYILGIVDENTANLPKIRYEGNINVGIFINKSLVPVYLELTRAFNTENIKTSSMSFFPKYAEVYLDNGLIALINNDKSIADSVKTLQTLLRQISLEGKKAQKIDLRYDKVIVSYE